MSTLAEKAQLLRQLHVPGDPLVLPNIWDVASAQEVVRAGFPVVATASNAVAESLGYFDGEGAPSDVMFAVACRIAQAVDVPVTVDAEAGYGLSGAELVDRLTSLGAAGCNLEDSDHRNGGQVPQDARARYIREMRTRSQELAVPFFINARVDSFFSTSTIPKHVRLEDAVARARTYVEAGADCVFPIAADTASIASMIDFVGGLVSAGLPAGPQGLRDAARMGLARASMGPQLYRRALKRLREDLSELSALPTAERKRAH